VLSHSSLLMSMCIVNMCEFNHLYITAEPTTGSLTKIVWWTQSSNLNWIFIFWPALQHTCWALQSQQITSKPDWTRKSMSTTVCCYTTVSYCSDSNKESRRMKLMLISLKRQL